MRTVGADRRRHDRAVPLNDRLAASGPPRVLFTRRQRLGPDGKPQAGGGVIPRDGRPELFRTRTGRLLMLWSSYDPHQL